MAAPPAMLYDLRRLLPAPAAAARPGYHALGRVDELLLDSGRVLMLLGALVLMWQPVVAAPLGTGHLLAAFLLWLLGTGAAMLSLVARRVPRLAAAGAVTAAALRNYLLGGL